MNIDYKVAEVELSYKSTHKNNSKVMKAADAYNILLPTFREGTINYKEYFKVLFLNKAHKILGYTLISEGGIDATAVDVRLIMQAALLTNASAIIVAHNHPSGNLTPSNDDRRMTEIIKQAAETLQIKLLDHIIMSDEGYYSFEENGLIFNLY